QVNRIDIVLKEAASPFRKRSGILDIGTHPIDVTIEDRFRENIRREIAVAALGAAEGNRDVQAKGHTPIIPFSPRKTRLRARPRVPEGLPVQSFRLSGTGFGKEYERLGCNYSGGKDI